MSWIYLKRIKMYIDEGFRLDKAAEKATLDLGEEEVNEIKNTRLTLRETLKDEGLHYTYISNIAMLLYDNYNISKENSNKAAEDILKLMFEGE